MPKQIAILYTGGTAGMQATHRGLQPMSIEQFSAALKSVLQTSHYGASALDLCASEPVLDSARMKPHDWVRLARDVTERYQEYDSFLLIVGTDTMPFAASALSFLLENLGKPLVITGARLPISHPGSDAPSNISGALDVLQQAECLFEVAIYFNGKLIRGNRSLKVSTEDPQVIDSPRFPYVGELTNGVLTLRNDLLLPKPHKGFTIADVTHPLPLVSLLRVYPGLDNDMLLCALKRHVSGLILETYGSGTVAEDAEMLGTLENAARRGVVVVSTTQCLRGTIDMDRYKSGHMLCEAGVISGGDMTTPAAFAKLVYLCAAGNSNHAVRDMMARNLSGELTPAGKSQPARTRE